MDFKSFTEAMTATFRSQNDKSFLGEFKNLSLKDKFDYWLAFKQSGYNVPPPVKPKDTSDEEYNATLAEYTARVK